MHCIVTTSTKRLDLGVRREIDKPISGSKDDLAAKGSRLISDGARQAPRELKTNYPLTFLFDVHAGDGACNNQALDLTGPFEDRLGLKGAIISSS